MIINCREFQSFEKKMIEQKNLNIRQKFKIINALYEEAIALGALPLKNPLEGIDIDIKIARVVNSVSKPA